MNPAIITRLDLWLAAPEIFVLAAACIILLIDIFLDERTRWESFALSLLALAGAAWVTAKRASTFARSRAHPAHSEDICQRPAEESNLV